MFSKIYVFLVLFVGYLSYIHGDRSDVITTYQPILQQIRSIYLERYRAATNQYDTLVKTINNNTAEARNEGNAQIVATRNLVNAAKALAVNSSSVLACVRRQEALTGTLSINSISSICNSAQNLTRLRILRDSLNTLGNVANQAPTWCSYLNPLEAQSDGLKECLVSKIGDLLDQIGSIKKNYENLSNSTLAGNVDCIAGQMGTLFNRIGSISYETNLCLVKL